jgi:hypothetical protein
MVDTLVQDGSGGTPGKRDQVKWAEQADMLTIPVLGVGDDYEPWLQYEKDMAVPTVVQLGPDLKILSMDEYAYDPGPYIE